MNSGLSRVERLVAVLVCADAEGDVVVNGGVWALLAADERVPFRRLCADVGIRLVESLPATPALVPGDVRLPCNPKALPGSALWIMPSGHVDGCSLLGALRQ